MARLKNLVVAAHSISAEAVAASADGTAPENSVLRAVKFLRADHLSLDSLCAPRKSPAYTYLQADKKSVPAEPGEVPVSKATIARLAAATEGICTAYDLITVFGEALILEVIERLAALPDAPPVVAVLEGCAHPETLRPLARLNARKRIGRIVTFDPVRHLYAVEALGIPTECVELIPAPVDQRYFRPAEDGERDPDSVALVWSDLADQSVVAAVGKSVKGKARAVLRGSASLPKGIQKIDNVAGRRKLWQTCGVALFAEQQGEHSYCIDLVQEAMSCGAPVVLTRTMPLEHLIRHDSDGLVVNPGDKAGAVAAIRRISSNPDVAAQMARNARQKVEEMMSLAHFANRLGRICKATAGKQKHAEFFLAPSQVQLAGESIP